MYWYNPTTRTSERVESPLNDEQAIHMLAGDPASATFVSEYADLRRSGTPIERALVSVGHDARLRQHDYTPVRLVEHEGRARRARPRASGYQLLVALRLREEGNLRQRIL
jgi:hypothetical protein